MKQLAATAATAVVLQKFKPIEMIPVELVRKFAGEIELAVGIVGTYGIVVRKFESDIAKGIAGGMVVSGALKVINKYIAPA